MALASWPCPFVFWVDRPGGLSYYDGLSYYERHLPHWQPQRWVRGPSELEKIVRYIERNPVSAGLVDSVEKWRWSSAYL